VEIGSVHRASSITDDVAKNAGFYAGVLGMRLIYNI
jgi:catechol 2,3-dioxygenase-like lactoylglutathione lyase family enzyme